MAPTRRASVTVVSTVQSMRYRMTCCCVLVIRRVIVRRNLTVRRGPSLARNADRVANFGAAFWEAFSCHREIRVNKDRDSGEGDPCQGDPCKQVTKPICL